MEMLDALQGICRELPCKCGAAAKPRGIKGAASANPSGSGRGGGRGRKGPFPAGNRDGKARRTRGEAAPCFTLSPECLHHPPG